jgi:hypothetical protein
MVPFVRDWEEYEDDERDFEIKQPKSILNKNDRKHLQFIFDRLEEVYNENPNYDYMIKFKEIINKIR